MSANAVAQGSSPPPVVVVTGASAGVGRATARRLAEIGFDVVQRPRRQRPLPSPGGRHDRADIPAFAAGHLGRPLWFDRRPVGGGDLRLGAAAVSTSMRGVTRPMAQQEVQTGAPDAPGGEESPLERHHRLTIWIPWTIG